MHWQRFCFEEGWAGVHWPEEYGGMGLTPAHNIVWHEECAIAEVAPYLNLQGLVLAGEAILRSGTPQQRERFLRPTLRNEILWCQLFSEPGAGSDLAGLQTSAVADGDQFCLMDRRFGLRMHSSLNSESLWLEPTTTNPKHKGISFAPYWIWP